jgi:putative Holliday junction resolvase
VRILGLDIGEKRIGVAVSDPSGTVATPLAVIDARKALGDGRELARLVEDYEAELLVAGLPLSLDGSEGPQAARVRSAAERLAKLMALPLEFADERLSSASARRTMTEAGVSDRDKRGSIDMVAAAIFLQGYLDARKATNVESEG